jgi:hypothetical protein
MDSAETDDRTRKKKRKENPEDVRNERNDAEMAQSRPTPKASATRLM